MEICRQNGLVTNRASHCNSVELEEVGNLVRYNAALLGANSLLHPHLQLLKSHQVTVIDHVPSTEYKAFQQPGPTVLESTLPPHQIQTCVHCQPYA